MGKHLGGSKNVEKSPRVGHFTPVGTDPDGLPHLPGCALFKERWAELIKKVYEADPLGCPRCGAAMRIIAFIDQPGVIEKTLTCPT